MAEENTATSSHLDSYMHVYDNGTTARLYVTPWDRNTVADGYWQTVNTIQPLINRDIYLADCIDKLAEKYTRYMPGYGISMKYNTVKDFWTISVDAEEVIAGCNYTYSNVILENTIDLTNKTGYLQICYPYVTVYGTATNVNRNCGIIPQMIMTYEGTN